MDSSRAENVQVEAGFDSTAQSLLDHLCEQLIQGFSLRSVCRKKHVSPNTFYSLIVSSPEALKRYARAREIQAENYADEIVEISDTEPDPNKARVRVEARKWVAAKLLPKKYGDIPNQTNFNQTIVIPVLSQEKQQELQERRRKLLEG